MGDELRAGDDDDVRRDKKFEFEFTDTYRPTKGVRIVEFESHEFLTKDGKSPGNEEKNMRSINVEIQLWDVSGDRKYAECWPAIKRDANGVILIANPEEHTGTDLLEWYSEFVEKEGLEARSVLVLLNEQGPKKTNHELVSAFKILPQLRNVHHIACHFATEGASVKQDVNNFLINILFQDEETRKKQNVREESKFLVDDIEEDDF
ncbi:unnamed protein product [Caenorhabditis bovis]|uniref:Rab-like protein 5 n=1 Tax=Caenorhabditis bovis TaxID=2654633 RepID=A0A8S1EV70_9PELO|nr:unnamed protein product [Caenorhabditis bovis]